MPSTVAPETRDRSDTAFFGHPRGLSTLFFTEMWERFSYYGMRAFLLLFMVADKDKGGMGLSAAEAGIIYGMYTASVYLMSVPGGWIADRYLGLQRAVLIGGALIMFGHVSLALPIDEGFFVGLGLVVLGTGLLKPNISAIVGRLYGQTDARRDSGYSIYYMGINIGAFLAPLVCGFLAQSNTFRTFLSDQGIDPNSAWHFGFGAAAVGMFFGLVQYVLGTRHLKDAGKRPTPPANELERKRNHIILVAAIAAVIAVPILFGFLDARGVMSVDDSFSILLAILPVGLFTSLMIWGCTNTDERRRLAVIMVLFTGAAMFWACFDQAGSTLNLFAERHTRNSLLGFEFPSSWFQSINAVFVVALAPVFAVLWVVLARRGKEPSSPAKFGAGLVLVGLGFAVLIPAAFTIDGPETVATAFVGVEHSPVKVSPGWLVMLYLVHTMAEMCLSPVGLSSMSKLAPERIGGLVMGIWFLASAVGNFLAGRAAGFSDRSDHVTFLTVMILLPAALGVVLFILTKPIGRMLARGETAAPPAAH
jgi:POT family proton-dependent oligopeptide transporter